MQRANVTSTYHSPKDEINTIKVTNYQLGSIFSDFIKELIKIPGHFFITNNENNEWIAVLAFDHDVTIYGTGDTYIEAILNVTRELERLDENNKGIQELEKEIAQI